MPDTPLRVTLNGVTFDADDLALLDPFQVATLPERAPAAASATVFGARPWLRHTLTRRAPAIRPWLDALPRAAPADRAGLLAAWEAVAWSVVDLLVYHVAPHVYDAHGHFGWSFDEVTGLCALDGRVVVDVGSGTGRLALLAAPRARVVYAVEPASTLRRYLRAKLRAQNVHNVYVLEGFAHRIPLPPASVDVVLSSHAFGWRLDEELAEIDRLLRPGGDVVHLTEFADDGHDSTLHQTLLGEPWRYRCAPFEERDGIKRKYYRLDHAP